MFNVFSISKKNSRIWLAALVFTLLCTLAAGHSLSSQLPERFFEEYGAIMLVIDPKYGAIREADQAAAHFYGYSVAQLKRMNIAQINALDEADVESERLRAEQEDRNYFIFPHRLASGEVRTVEVYSWPLRTDSGEMLLFSVILDISGKAVAEASMLEYKDRMEALAETRYQELLGAQERISKIRWLATIAQLLIIAVLVWNILHRRKAEKKLRDLAYYDQLTGLPNRNQFQRKLRKLRRTLSGSETVLAFAIIDIDHFKNINDALGHAKGDEILTGLAHRLSTLLQPEEVLARFGGDEFALLLLESGSGKEAERILGERLQKIQKVLAEPLCIGQSEFLLGSSLGVTFTRDFSRSFNDLHKEADTALYAAKAAGRATWRCFEPGMQVRAEQRFALEGDLRKAIEGNQLRLFLQPKINRDGVVYGTESLLRWEHPDKGNIVPGSFIPLAEDTGLILPLGDWVMRETMLLMREHPELGFAVNISPRQFRNPDFACRVETLLRETGAEPSRLTLEVTENLLITDFSQVLGSMQRLQKLGICFSIDDFGTGYSSLSYLKQLPINELKIDRSFISGLPHDSSDVLLVDTMMAIAGHLGLVVVAEGVESEQQRDYLFSVGCILHQGYYYGKPEPARELLAKIRMSRPLV